jgi:anti-sigma factor RsiW
MSAQERSFDELLGAYALDAVDADERREIDEYLAVSPRAAHEVRQHREVATLLAWSSMAPPEGLWDRIASSLDGEAPVPSGELAKVLPMRRRRRATTVAAAWIAASAAAAVLAVVSFQVLRSDPSPAPLAAAVAQARADRTSVSADIRSADGSIEVRAVVDGAGHGFLEAASLPSLPLDRTYQLWGVIDGKAISLGVLGHRPDVEPFTVHGTLTQLVITNEVAGGVISDGNPVGALAGAVV